MQIFRTDFCQTIIKKGKNSYAFDLLSDFIQKKNVKKACK